MNNIRDDDYTLTPTGPLGGKLQVMQYNRHLGDFTDYQDAESAIREDMESEQFYPNIWYISDHGNVIPYNLESV